MEWLLFIAIGAGCGFVSARSRGASKTGDVMGSMAVGAIAAIVLGVLVTFVFSFLFFLAKVACVIFGVLLVLALLGVGKSD